MHIHSSKHIHDVQQLHLRVGNHLVNKKNGSLSYYERKMKIDLSRFIGHNEFKSVSVVIFLQRDKKDYLESYHV